MFSQNDIQEGETDVPGNIHGVSLNKELEKGAKRRMFSSIYYFHKRIKKNTQFK